MNTIQVRGLDRFLLNSQSPIEDLDAFFVRSACWVMRSWPHQKSKRQMTWPNQCGKEGDHF